MSYSLLARRAAPSSDGLGNLLSSSNWARHLTPEQIQRVREDISVRCVPAAGYVCRTGEEVDCWVGIIEGLVKLCAVSPTGKETTFIGVPKGGWFSEGSLLKDEPRRYDGIAVRDCTVACLPRSTFLWLLRQSFVFNQAIIAQLNERLRQMIDLVVSDRLFDPNARVAHCLASLYNPHLCHFAEPSLSISQEEIGFLAGLSRQRVNCALKALESIGILKIEPFGIAVPDPDRLRRFAIPQFSWSDCQQERTDRSAVGTAASTYPRTRTEAANSLEPGLTSVRTASPHRGELCLR